MQSNPAFSADGRALRPFFLFIALVLGGTLSFAHPMGGLSVNHYAKLIPSSGGVEVVFALDLAEMPTLELLQSWGMTKDTPREVLQQRAVVQARDWVSALSIAEDGKPLPSRIETTDLMISEGTGSMPVFRITIRLSVAAKGGRVEFTDSNYSSRTGWREIVIQPGDGVEVSKASKGAEDVSRVLTVYPTSQRLQDSRGWFEWRIAKGPVTRVPVIESIAPEPAATIAPQNAAVESQPGPPARQSDEISKMLRTANLSWGAIALLLFTAFWFGAVHALDPGHGKTMVAAYLVGARGTPKHALILGGAVTFTHTISVFILGIITLFLSQYIMPAKISKVLGIISGLSIVWIGGLLLWRRVRNFSGAQSHKHSRAAGQMHSHGDLTHSHGGDSHSHLPEGDINMKSLIALGASGGLVPCPSALILLLSAVSLGRIGLGLILLVAFSIGLAMVLTGTGLVVLFAKKFLPRRKGRTEPLMQALSVMSAAVILVIGIVMTSYSLGWLPSNRFIG